MASRCSSSGIPGGALMKVANSRTSLGNQRRSSSLSLARLANSLICFTLICHHSAMNCTYDIRRPIGLLLQYSR